MSRFIPIIVVAGSVAILAALLIVETFSRVAAALAAVAP